MAATYEQIIRLMEVFPAYSEQGQIEAPVRGQVLRPDIKPDDGVITSRDQWYKHV